MLQTLNWLKIINFKIYEIIVVSGRSCHRGSKLFNYSHNFHGSNSTQTMSSSRDRRLPTKCPNFPLVLPEYNDELMFFVFFLFFFAVSCPQLYIFLCIGILCYTIYETRHYKVKGLSLHSVSI